MKGTRSDEKVQVEFYTDMLYKKIYEPFFMAKI